MAYSGGDMIRETGLKEAAKLLVLAAKTAPKTKGQDFMEILVLGKEEVEKLGKKMIELGLERDGKNVLDSEYVLIVSTTDEPANLNCGGCGFKDCGEYEKNEKVSGNPC